MDEIYNDMNQLYDDLARVRSAFDRDVDKIHYRHLIGGNEVSRAEVEDYYLANSLRGRHIALLAREIERWES